MARWLLKEKAYLNVPGTEYDYAETDEQTGVRNRVIFKVPRYLDPEDPRQKRSAEGLVVAYSGSQQKGDWIFEGPPIMGMEPLDAEAEEITAEMQRQWGQQFVGGDEDSSHQLVKMMADTLASFKAQAAPSSLAALPDVDDLKKQIADLTAVVKALQEPTEKVRRA